MILFSYQLIPNNPLNFSGRVSFDKEFEIFFVFQQKRSVRKINCD